MSNVPPPHVIIQIAEGNRVACDGYYDLPVILPAYIGLITDGSAIGDREGSRLRMELRRQILSLPGARLETRELPCGSCPAYRADFNCTAIDRTRFWAAGGSTTRSRWRRARGSVCSRCTCLAGRRFLQSTGPAVSTSTHLAGS